MLAANVSEEYGYIGVRIHVQYPFSRSRSSSEKVIVKGIEINSIPYQLETVFIDERITGSRTDYSYRINDLFEGEISSVQISIVEKLADGEKEYTLDLANRDIQLNNTPAIVKGEGGGNVYDAPSSSIQPIGQLFAGTKVTVYFTTDDGWAAIGAGSRNAEIWGYMHIEDLYVGENEIYHMMSQIRQLSVEDSCFVYGDVECIHILYGIQKGTSVVVIGNFGNTCFIRSGYQYGYMPADTMSTCLLDLSSDSSFLYQADVRRALLTT